MLKSIDDLRSEGYFVSVCHSRYVKDSYTLKWVLLSQRQILDEYGSLEYVSCRGGFTTVHVTTPEGVKLYGYAKCSFNDNFQRKVGVSQAMKRAFEKVYAVSNNGTEMKRFNKLIAAESWLAKNGGRNGTYGWEISEVYKNQIETQVNV